MEKSPQGPANPNPVSYQVKAKQRGSPSRWTTLFKFALPPAILGQVYLTYDDFLSQRQSPELGDWHAWAAICIGLFPSAVLTGLWIQLVWPSKGRWAKAAGIHPCSFCGKSPSERKKIIAGPGVYICESCVAVCKTMLARELNSSGKE